MKETAGPVYKGVASKHSYGHDYVTDTSSRETHGPVMKVERRHGYGADWSVRHRTASPCAGPVMNADRKHNYNGDFSVRRRSASPGLVGQSHSYQGQMASTVKSELGTMVGPVYNMASAKHNFTGGYTAPKTRQDQVDLVGKFFQKEQKEVVRQEQKSSFESSQTTSFSSSTSTKVETKIESAGGEERRAEALERRKEFLKQQEDLRMKVTSSQFSAVQSKTRQQLEEEREAMFAASVKRVQEESRMQMERAKMEEQKRLDFLKQEEERLKREEVLRQEAMIRAEEERRRKEAERKEEMRKQQEMMQAQRDEMERERLLKRQQEEEERRRQEKLRQESERQVSTTKTEIITRKEESNNMEEMKRMHEQKILERQRLEMMISQESKMTAGQVSKRADDVHGLGWGNVTTGFVNRKKLGFLQRASDSMERDWSAEASPAPSGGRRVTWADSSSGSRPDSRLQDVDTLRAQTPPLAGEWAVTKSAAKSVSQQANSFSQQQTGGVQFSGQSSTQASAFSSTQQMSSSQQISSTQQMSSSSSQKTSFSQSTSSSFQSSSIEASKAFEAFPGMNGIENLRLEQ